MKLSLRLDWDLGEGALAPYLIGLREGRAVGCRCRSCGHVAFPPEQVCNCGVRDIVQEVLAGDAEILWRTWGVDGEVALVRFTGADTLSVARLAGFSGEDRGRIVPDQDSALVISPCKEPT